MERTSPVHRKRRHGARTSNGFRNLRARGEVLTGGDLKGEERRRTADGLERDQRCDRDTRWCNRNSDFRCNNGNLILCNGNRARCKLAGEAETMRSDILR